MGIISCGLMITFYSIKSGLKKVFKESYLCEGLI